MKTEEMERGGMGRRRKGKTGNTGEDEERLGEPKEIWELCSECKVRRKEVRAAFIALLGCGLEASSRGGKAPFLLTWQGGVVSVQRRQD